MTADFYTEKRRQTLIALVRRWLPEQIKPLFDELLSMK
jgi:hypothetical protein